MKKAWYKNHLLHSFIFMTFKNRQKQHLTLEGRITIPLGRKQYLGCIWRLWGVLEMFSFLLCVLVIGYGEFIKICSLLQLRFVTFLYVYSTSFNRLQKKTKTKLRQKTLISKLCFFNLIFGNHTPLDFSFSIYKIREGFSGWPVRAPPAVWFYVLHLPFQFLKQWKKIENEPWVICY